ncbi:hypothetical protein [Limosilactobacillus ingluviei]|uniref:hypothetical protein n=1 Tax=Limosilactobacillus ingluviei TaxID=148604 RepID=UPI0024B98452|nr:hypothetical protein [Limosilactobacillus ingluviei]
MQLQRIELKKLGTTERILRSDTQGNFGKLENAVNSNAGATEAGYKQLGADLTAEAQERKMGDDNETRDRRAADQALEDRISQSEERLTKRIAALEDMLFGQRPQEVKMAENSTPPGNGGAMLVNLTNTNEEDK